MKLTARMNFCIMSALLFMSLTAMSCKKKEQSPPETTTEKALKQTRQKTAPPAKQQVKNSSIPQPPPMEECLKIKIAKPVDTAGAILRSIKGKASTELADVKCFEKTRLKTRVSFKDCMEHECLAWIDYWLEEAKYNYQQLNMDSALKYLIKASLLSKKCKTGGKTASQIYIYMGITLIDGFGEIMKGSLSFKWALLYDWNATLPPNPAPNVQKTFEVVKQAIGSKKISCKE